MCNVSMESHELAEPVEAFSLHSGARLCSFFYPMLGCGCPRIVL